MVPFDRDMWPFLWKAPLLLLLVGLLVAACSSTPSVPERPGTVRAGGCCPW